MVLSPKDEYVDRVRALGARHIHLELDNGGVNPFKDIRALTRLTLLFRKEKPDVVLTFTPKVNIYGSLAGRITRVPVIANISGLGTGFIRGGWLTVVVKCLYRLALRHPVTVFFENEDDLSLFVKAGLVRESVVRCLPGSGVDVDGFSPVTLTPIDDKVVFLVVARLLWDKGIGEYVEAARLLKRDFPIAEFRVLGFFYTKNPTAISREQMAAWESEGVIRYLGATDDVAPHYASADCVVLASYREGTPRSLLEAASMGKPIIATDAPGCRNVLEDGVTGFLVGLRDSTDLAEKMKKMLLLPPQQRRLMGERGREKMIREFDERIVIERYLTAIAEVFR